MENEILWSRIKYVLQAIVSLGGPWVKFLNDLVSKWGLLDTKLHKGQYDVLNYETILELKDRKGKKAFLRKYEKIRYLQDNIIAFQDQAWGDGKILINYRCTPGIPEELISKSSRAPHFQ